MQIRWRNILAIVLIIFAVVLAVKLGPQIGSFFEGLARPARHRTLDDRIFTLCVVGMLLVTTVAVVRLLVQRKTKDP